MDGTQHAIICVVIPDVLTSYVIGNSSRYTNIAQDVLTSVLLTITSDVPTQMS